MPSIHLRPFLAALAAVLALAAGAAPPAAFAQPDASATRSSVERGVTVKVTPKTVTGPTWEFAIVLDTHAEDLKDDLQKTAVLVVDGREFQPTAWQGPGAGGHHREGVLAFAAPTPAPATIELRIQRPGEAAPRVFRWEPASLK
jgi:hypothetical protein